MNRCTEVIEEINKKFPGKSIKPSELGEVTRDEIRKIEMMMCVYYNSGYSEGIYDRKSAMEQAYNAGYDDGMQDNAAIDKVLWADMIDKPYFEEGVEYGATMAWEAARKLIISDQPEYYDLLEKAFGNMNAEGVLRTYTAEEAIEKIRVYEEEKKDEFQIVPGDIVEGREGLKYVVMQAYLNASDEQILVLYRKEDGDIDNYHLYYDGVRAFKKTGRRIPEVSEMIKAIGEDKDE